jgi:hypothetical protein
MQKKQAFEMMPPKERRQTDREWVGGATPFLKKLPPWTRETSAKTFY